METDWYLLVPDNYGNRRRTVWAFLFSSFRDDLKFHLRRKGKQEVGRGRKKKNLPTLRNCMRTADNGTFNARDIHRIPRQKKALTEIKCPSLKG